MGVTGSLKTRSWEDNEGKKHYKSELVVNDITLLSNGDSEGNGAGAHDVHHTIDIEVRSELAFDLGCGHLFKIVKQAVARTVDQNVDAAELLHRLLDGRFCSCLVGNAQLDKRDVLACRR